MSTNVPVLHRLRLATHGVAVRIDRMPRVVVAAVLVLLSLGAWVFASPVGSSPDDDFHLTSIWCADGNRAYACEPGPTQGTREVPKGVAAGQCYAGHPSKSASCQDPLLTGNSVADAQTARGSFDNNYPPVFYAVMGLLVTPNIQISVILMRFLTVLLFCGLAVCLFIALPRHRRAPLIWGWVVTVVPLGMFLLASNNPSSWAIIGLGSVWISLLGFLETTGRRKIALGALLAISVVIAAGSRGDAAIYSIVSMAAVVLLTIRRERAYFVNLLLPLALSIIAFLFFVGSQQSAVVSTGLSSEGSAEKPPAHGILSLAAFNLLNVPSLWAGVFGGWGLGWLDTEMPAVVTAAGIIAFLVAATVGLGRVWRRKALVVCLLILAIWVIPAYVLVRGGQHVGDTVQPRYILPLMIVLAGVAMLTEDHSLRWGRFLLTVIGVALVVSNTVALQTNIRRYVTGVGEQGFNLDSGKEWWWHVPFSPMADWVVGSLAFAALILLLGRAVWRARDDSPEMLTTSPNPS